MLKKLKSPKLLPANLAKSLSIVMHKENALIAKWSQSATTEKNWGDAINAVMIEKISGKKVFNHADLIYTGNAPIYSVIGSVLDQSRVRNLEVWGSGFKTDKSPMHVLPSKVHAVRGPLTRQKLLSLGVDCPEVYGDPALLFPEYFPVEDQPVEYELGIIPHYTDKNNSLLKNLARDSRVLVIDIEAGIMEFPTQVKKCRHIVSSSLHGLILADAYGIPNAQIRLSNRIKGGNFKFNDYRLSVGRPEAEAIDVDASVTIDKLLESCSFHPLTINLESLKKSCPF